jgi:choline transport protein
MMNPQRDIPIAVMYQMAIGFVTGFAYLIALLYCINDFDALFDSPYPIATIYQQATNSTAATTGLLALILLCIGVCVIDLYVTCGRTLWTLARDGATPFSSTVSKVSRRFEVPIVSTVITAVLVTALGGIYMGSATVFNAFVGSYILMSTSSYLAAILPNLLRARKSIATYGPFRMRGWVGFVVNGIACIYMLVWFPIYSLPFSLPTSATAMNWAPALWSGFTILIGGWWLAKARQGYTGPPTLNF